MRAFQCNTSYFFFQYTKICQTCFDHRFDAHIFMFSGVDWRDLFDLVVVGAHKPDYLVNPLLSMFQVDRYRPPTYLLFIVVCFIMCLCIFLFL